MFGRATIRLGIGPHSSYVIAHGWRRRGTLAIAFETGDAADVS